MSINLPDVIQRVVLDTRGYNASAKGLSAVTNKAAGDAEKLATSHDKATKSVGETGKASDDTRSRVDKMGDTIKRTGPKVLQFADHFFKARMGIDQTGKASANAHPHVNRLGRTMLDGSKSALLFSAKIGLVGSGLLAVIPLAGALGGGLVGLTASLLKVGGVLPALALGFGALASGLGVALLLFKGVADGMKAQEKAGKSNADTAKRVAAAQKSGADAIAAAQKRVHDAVRGVADANQRLTDANVKVMLAQDKLNRSYEEARQALIDLRRETERAGLSQERADLNLARARENLNRVMFDATSTELDRRDAILDVKTAELDLADAQDANRKSQKDLANSEAKGIDRSDLVTAAHADVVDAQRDQIKSTQDLQDALDNLAESQQDVVKAQQDMAEAIASAKDSGGGLDPKAPTKAMLPLIAALKELKKAAAPITDKARSALFPGAVLALGVIGGLMNKLQGNFVKTAGIVGDLFGGLAVTLDGLVPQIDRVWSMNNSFLESMNDVANTALTALINIADAASPVVGLFREVANRFNDWLTSVTNSEDFTKRTTDMFIRAFVAAISWWHIIRDTVAGVANVFKAATDAGDGLAISIERGAAHFRDWSNDDKTQDKLRTFFSRAAELTRTIGRLLQDVAGAMFKISGGPGLAGINDMLTTLEKSDAWKQFLNGITGWGTTGLKAVADTVTSVIDLLNGNATAPQWMSDLADVFKKLGDTNIRPLQTSIGVVSKFLDAIAFAEKNVPGFDKLVTLVVTLAAVKMVAGRTGITGIAESLFNIRNFVKGFNSKGVVTELRKINTNLCAENCVGGGMAGKISNTGTAINKNQGTFDGMNTTLGKTQDNMNKLTVTTDKAPGKFSKLGTALGNSTGKMAALGGVAYGAGQLIGGKLGHALQVAGIAATATAGFIELLSDTTIFNTIVTKAAAAGQWLLNAAMDANPIMLIVLAIAALAAGIFILYKNNAGFRKFIDGIWQSIQKAWDVVLPILKNVVGWIVDKVIVAFKMMAHDVGVVFGVIATVASWLWDHVLSYVFNALKSYIFDFLIPAFKIWWEVVSTVFGFIANIANWLWDHVLKPVFGFIQDHILSKVIPAFQTFWDVVSKVFDYISDKISSKWDTIKGIFETIIGFLKDTFGKAWQNLGEGISIIWTAIGDVISGAMDTAMDVLRAGLRTVGSIVSKVLGLLATVASAVHLDGLASTLLKGAAAADRWGAEPAPTTSNTHQSGNAGAGHAFAIATGGTVPLAPFENAPRTEVGSGFKTGTPRAIVGEGSRHPEFVIPTDPKYRTRAKSLVGEMLTTMNGGMPLMARGGRVPGTGDFIGDRENDLKNLAGKIVGTVVPKDIFDQIRQLGAAAMEKIIPKLPTTDGITGIVPSGVNTLRQAAIDFIKGDVDRQAAAMGTGGGWRALVAQLVAAGIPHKIISTDRPGARTHAGGNVSLHALGRAVDLQGPGGAGDIAGGMKIFDFFGANRGNISELIYSHAPYYISRGGIQKPIGQLNSVTKGDHWDHVHAGAKEAAVALAAVGSGLGGANRSIGRSILESMGLGAQWPALDQLWTHESGWNNTAQNPVSTAYGIAQFLNGTWAGTGYSKTSDPTTQIKAGLKYIQGKYGDPNGAWNYWQAHHSYGRGGRLEPVALSAGGIVDRETLSRIGEMGRKEAVIPLESPRGRAALEGMGTNFTLERGAVQVVVGENANMAEVQQAVEDGITKAFNELVATIDGHPI